MTYDPRDTIGYRLGLLARHWRQEVDLAMRALGMTEATWRPLLHLAQLGEAARQKDLAESMGIDGSSLVRLLDHLEERGLIRRGNGSDRRTKSVCLTEAGGEAMAQARTVVRALERELLGGFSDAEAASLAHALEMIESAIAERRNR